ncbi:DUF3592 domain-containing protein [Streptomyces sp. NPDC057411]|uniref:DUF3592 domain-containing protein n=1 Tax=unclassified Streptomyces TaxID=2593676 RepID=UPI00363F3046
MSSDQILRGRGVYAALDADGLHVVRGGRRTSIPLAAVREIRVPEPRSIEIVLTDGAAHRVDGDNPTATAAFAETLTGALPEQRDPAGSALVTTTGTGTAEGVRWGVLALVASPVLAYTGYAIWVGATHGVRILGVVLGVIPLLIGLVLLFSGVQELYRRIVLARRGITVRAERIGPTGKKSTMYGYADADGGRQTYTCTRKTPGLLVTYDPRKPERAVHEAWLGEVIARVALMLLAGLVVLGIGLEMAFSDILW